MKREIVTRYVVDVPVRLADVLISDMKTGTKRKKTKQKPKISLLWWSKALRGFTID